MNWRTASLTAAALLLATGLWFLISPFPVRDDDSPAPRMSGPGPPFHALPGAPTGRRKANPPPKAQEGVDEKSNPPRPGRTPAATAKALYGDELFFGLRGFVPESATNHLGGSLSPELLAHFEQYRTDLAAWHKRHEGEVLKPPINEGCVFLGNYEAADDFEISGTSITGDRAVVLITLHASEAGQTYSWTDAARFIKSGERWLLDDIAWRIGDEGSSGSLREGFIVNNAD